MSFEFVVRRIHYLDHKRNCNEKRKEKSEMGVRKKKLK